VLELNERKKGRSNATQLTVRIYLDYIPKDSYARSFLGALEDYTNIRVPMAVYFRDVDQSDPEIQRQMRDFIDDISNLQQVGNGPDACWVRDMYEILNVVPNSSALREGHVDSDGGKIAFLAKFVQHANITFEERLDVMLGVPVIRDVYGSDIVRDDDGHITASRCYILVRHIDLSNINEQIDMLHEQRFVTMEQPINQLPENRKDMAFFAYDELFAYWQLVRFGLSWCVVTAGLKSQQHPGCPGFPSTLWPSTS
jgi:hypothetical protein